MRTEQPVKEVYLVYMPEYTVYNVLGLYKTLEGATRAVLREKAKGHNTNFQIAIVKVQDEQTESISVAEIESQQHYCTCEITGLKVKRPCWECAFCPLIFSDCRWKYPG